VKPQECDELAKHRDMEAINARLAQHDRMVQLILILVVVLSVMVLGLLIYHR
jgi:hypothetical protein